MLNLITGLAFGLLISSLVAVFTTRSARRRGIAEGMHLAMESFRREQEAAVHLFLSRLTSLITRPCEEEALRARAESVIDLIQSYQSAIADITQPMAPQLRELRASLAAADMDPRAKDGIRNAFTSLRSTWPAQRTEIEMLVRQLLAQLTTVELEEPIATTARRPSQIGGRSLRVEQYDLSGHSLAATRYSGSL